VPRQSEYHKAVLVRLAVNRTGTPFDRRGANAEGDATPEDFKYLSRGLRMGNQVWLSH